MYSTNKLLKEKSDIWGVDIQRGDDVQGGPHVKRIMDWKGKGVGVGWYWHKRRNSYKGRGLKEVEGK